MHSTANLYAQSNQFNRQNASLQLQLLGKDVLGCTKLNDILKALLSKREEIEKRIKTDHVFKNKVRSLLRLNLLRLAFNIYFYNLGSNNTPDGKNLKGMLDLVKHMGRLTYLYRIFPEIGRQVLDEIYGYSDYFKSPDLQAAFATLIKDILKKCPQVSIPYISATHFKKWDPARAHEKEEDKANNSVVFAPVLEALGTRYQTLNEGNKAIPAKLAGEVQTISATPLLTTLSKLDLSTETKLTEAEMDNPMLMVWSELFKRMNAQKTKLNFKTTTREFLVTIKNLMQALAEKKYEDAVFILIEGIKLNRKSSHVWKTRAELLEKLIEPFIQFNTDDIPKSKKLDSLLAICNYRFYEIAEFLRVCYKNFQAYLISHPADRSVFNTMMTGQIPQKLAKTSDKVADKPQYHASSGFRLNPKVKGLDHFFEKDPEDLGLGSSQRFI